ncbi:ribosomal protein L7/L12 [Batrachochytrium salamandrivorans]|nr:ribosomal protein L7/L12 [Batrachochytrium salamandrivorans]
MLLRRLSLAAATTAAKPSSRRSVDVANLTRLAQSVRALSPDELQVFHTKVSSAFGFPGVSKLLAELEDKASKIDVNAVAATAPVAVATKVVVEEVPVSKTSFNLKLESFPAGDKIKVIKVVRELLGLGLKETKEKVEAIPVVLKTDLIKDDAESWAAKLKAAGGVVVLE